MEDNLNLRVPLVGYSDRLSLRGGESIAFKLSAAQCRRDNPALVKSWLMHSVCADANPDGPGIIEHDASQWYAPAQHPVIEQAVHAGSCAVSTPFALPDALTGIQLGVALWPSHLNGAPQCVLACESLKLFIGDDHHVHCTFADYTLRLPDVLVERQWLHVTAHVRQINDSSLQLSLTSRKPESGAMNSGIGSVSDDQSHAEATIPVSALAGLDGKTARITVAAQHAPPKSIDSSNEPHAPAASIQGDIDQNASINPHLVHHFNGKIEAPEVLFTSQSTSKNSSSNASNSSPNASAVQPSRQNGNSVLRLFWDFADDMSAQQLKDKEGHGITLELINMPARAMKGCAWNGDEMCWRHAPQQYAAIHFHDDDLVDAGWQTNFTYTLPSDMPSGVYVMRISDGEHEDAMPFFVCAPKDVNKRVKTNKLCVLVSTFTYAIYGNHARPDWQASWLDKIRDWGAYPNNPAMYPGYGLSTYNYHSDGSGICHASHRRPLFNLRPGYITFGNTSCSGLRHFQADSHLLAWLDAMNIDFDIITDRELHDEGASCIDNYQMLLTGSHPEYHTAQTLNALQTYRDTGGHISYLGGNGFYWRIAIHPDRTDTLEIRRAEAGIRAWAAEPGEYYHAFDGQYGGLWRRNGRPPQALVGLGFSAQGEFYGSGYRRCNNDSQFEWMFKDIDDEVVGNFGLCGHGAAGFELDRADTKLGTPANATVLARSEGHGDGFILVPEEMLTHLTTLPGPSAKELIHADILWCDYPGGGSVFAVGSITFCGSLPYNGFDNNVSTMLNNVVEHVLLDHQNTA